MILLTPSLVWVFVQLPMYTSFTEWPLESAVTKVSYKMREASFEVKRLGISKKWDSKEPAL